MSPHAIIEVQKIISRMNIVPETKREVEGIILSVKSTTTLPSLQAETTRRNREEITVITVIEEGAEAGLEAAAVAVIAVPEVEVAAVIGITSGGGKLRETTIALDLGRLTTMQTVITGNDHHHHGGDITINAVIVVGVCHIHRE